jgi:hypothetical protein
MKSISPMALSPSAVYCRPDRRRDEKLVRLIQMIRSRTLSTMLAVAGSLPLVWFASRSLAGELPGLLADDPCFVWGQSSGAIAVVGVAPCEHGVGGTSETKASAITRLIVIQGGMLVAAAFALLGSYTGRRRLCVAASAMTFAIALPLLLGGFGIVMLLAAGCFFLSYAA